MKNSETLEEIGKGIEELVDVINEYKYVTTTGYMGFKDAKKLFDNYISCEMRDPCGLDDITKAMIAYQKEVQKPIWVGIDHTKPNEYMDYTIFGHFILVKGKKVFKFYGCYLPEDSYDMTESEYNETIGWTFQDMTHCMKPQEPEL